MTLKDCLEAHEKALKYGGGGLGGIRDVGLIESAIARPYNGYYRSIHSKAAALVHSLSKNHGFVDGNKRMALGVLGTFLFRTGYELRTDPKSRQERELEQMVLDVVEDRMRFEELYRWMMDHIRPERRP